MSDAPTPDRDLILHWEWFRRNQWMGECIGQQTATGRPDAIAALADELQAGVTLVAEAGFGELALALEAKGTNVIASDSSLLGIEHSRTLTAHHNASLTFFHAPLNELASKAPHGFDLILCTALEREPVWDCLGAAIRGLFQALNPGGVLAFTGAPEGCSQQDALRAFQKRYAQEPAESIGWSCRDGATACTQIIQRSLAPDFADERLLYVIDDRGKNALASTTRRIPGYWSWSHWQELILNAGFEHIQSRTFLKCGPAEQSVTLNLARKPDAAPSGGTSDPLSYYHEE